MAIGAIMVFMMVAIGGITRLTHSGLSMTNWHLIVGSIPPLNDQEWQLSFEAYKNFPEYKELNYGFTLEDYKSIFWWEYLHRLLGRVLGIVFLIPFLFFMVKGWLQAKLRNQLLVVFILGAFQAFLGWFMVKSGLVDMPRVSHFRLAAHLVTAFISCLYILWIIFEINYPKTMVNTPVFPFRRHILLLILLTFLQVIYGAFVAGLQAGFVHNTWPLMDGEVVSSAVFALDPVYLNFVNRKIWDTVRSPNFGHPHFPLGSIFIYKGSKIIIHSYPNSGYSATVYLRANPVWFGNYNFASSRTYILRNFASAVRFTFTFFQWYMRFIGLLRLPLKCINNMCNILFDIRANRLQ